ncbi:MAG: hypothetical protein RR335_10310, partial [Eubacterium sp.]
KKGEKMAQLIDSGPFIDVEKRTITGIGEMREIVVEGDDLSQMITFTMLNDFDGAGVIEKSIFVKYINAANFGDKVAAVNKRIEIIDVDIIDPETGKVTGTEKKEVLRFGWVVDKNVTQKSGAVYIAIEITGLNYKWSTKKAMMMVEETVDIAPTILIPQMTWLQAYEQQLEYLMDVYRQYLRQDYLNYNKTLGEKCPGCKVTASGLRTGTIPQRETVVKSAVGNVRAETMATRNPYTSEATGTLPEIAEVVGYGNGSLAARTNTLRAVLEGITTAEKEMTGTYPETAYIVSVVKEAILGKAQAQHAEYMAAQTGETQKTGTSPQQETVARSEARSIHPAMSENANPYATDPTAEQNKTKEV